MLKQLKKSNRADQKGFTIIEVMIVLAIAGLILLIVFLAVPALQRNSRNTRRRNDVSAYLAALQEAINNNNGSLPATCNGSAAACWVNQAKVGYYPTASANIVWTNNGTTPTTVADPADLDRVSFGSNSRCLSATASQNGTSDRQVAAMFDIESSAGLTAQCVET